MDSRASTGKARTECALHVTKHNLSSLCVYLADAEVDGAHCASVIGTGRRVSCSCSICGERAVHHDGHSSGVVGVIKFRAGWSFGFEVHCITRCREFSTARARADNKALSRVNGNSGQNEAHTEGRKR